MFSRIQESTALRSVNIPGDPLSKCFFFSLLFQPRAHPIPQEITPARVQAPCLRRHKRGPPESPCKKQVKAHTPQLTKSVHTSEQALKSLSSSLLCHANKPATQGTVI